MSSSGTNASGEEGSSPSEALSNCLLSQYAFCAGGVLGGAAYGIKAKKGLLPMVAAGVAGSVADLVYGYVVACEKEAKIYQDSSAKSEKEY